MAGKRQLQGQRSLEIRTIRGRQLRDIADWQPQSFECSDGTRVSGFILKAVIREIDDVAGADGWCFQSLATWKEKTAISATVLYRAIQALAEMELLRFQNESDRPRRHKDGMRDWKPRLTVPMRIIHSNLNAVTEEQYETPQETPVEEVPSDPQTFPPLSHSDPKLSHHFPTQPRAYKEELPYPPLELPDPSSPPSSSCTNNAPSPHSSVLSHGEEEEEVFDLKERLRERLGITFVSCVDDARANGWTDGQIDAFLTPIESSVILKGQEKLLKWGKGLIKYHLSHAPPGSPIECVPDPIWKAAADLKSVQVKRAPPKPAAPDSSVLDACSDAEIAEATDSLRVRYPLYGQHLKRLNGREGIRGSPRFLQLVLDEIAAKRTEVART